MDKKNGLALMVIGVAVLLVTVIGATFAYFSVQTSNNFGTKTITATAAEVGSVALAGGSNLTLSLTAADMMKGANDITYYATASGKTTTATSPVIATATVTGAGTFTCNYTITVTPSATNSMYTAFNGMTGKSAGQIVLTVASQTKDFYSTNFSQAQTISGTLTGITSSTAAASRQITAQFKIVNKKDVDQTALAGTDITLSFAVTAFTCTATA